MKHIVVLTGAGVSAESGLLTFRDNDGLWCNHRVEDVATPEAYARDPDLVHRFYNTRRQQLSDVIPNKAHIALAKLAANAKYQLTLITQNVDDLHERADSEVSKHHTSAHYQLIHMHGSLKKARCSLSNNIFDWEKDITVKTHCPCCDKPAQLRPHIVWFGEMPLDMDIIYQALRACDLFISIGTSGNVYPAAGFVQEIRQIGKGHTVELNMEPSSGHTLFEEAHYGPATDIVPKYLEQL